MRNKRVLVDCDGVMSDLITPALKAINAAGGTNFKYEDVVEYDICGGLGVPHMWDVLKKACATEGFVSGMGKVPLAYEGVTVLREIADVVAVTSPMTVPNWAYERQMWLEREMGFKKLEVVQTEAKFLIEADVLVDDKIENVLEWAKAHPDGLGIIFHARYNKNYMPEVTNISRAFGWNDVVLLCQNHLRDS